MNRLLLFLFLVMTLQLPAQTGSWQLWASGLPAGVYPKLTVAPNHDIFYALLGTGGPKGIIHKANTQSNQGNFVAMPPIPLPASAVNNINAVETNQLSEPIAGIFRNNVTDPWLFRLDQTSQQWVASSVDQNPTLGAFCMARGKNGTIWVGAKWAYVYKSTDDGHTFSHIDETALVKVNAPCYYPSWFGYDYDGAIYGINVDANGRVYAGTESAGVVYSDDQGLSWQAADLDACKDTDPTQKDSSSAMHALSISGNCGGIGFTADQKLVWSGPNMWDLNWTNKLGLADLSNRTVKPCLGLPDYMVQVGQQITRIVTASNGQLFLHSGGNAGAAGIGIYTSKDGENWALFNNGITGQNDGQSQGSLAVDSNMVFMATHDGKIWRYVITDEPSAAKTPGELAPMTILPNPASTMVQIRLPEGPYSGLVARLLNANGQACIQMQVNNPDNTLDVSTLPDGFYWVDVQADQQVFHGKLIIHHN